MCFFLTPYYFVLDRRVLFFKFLSSSDEFVKCTAFTLLNLFCKQILNMKERLLKIIA